MKGTNILKTTALLLAGSLLVTGCSIEKPAANPDSPAASEAGTESESSTENYSTENSSTENSSTASAQEGFKPLPPIDWDKATDLTREELEAASTCFYMLGPNEVTYGFNIMGEILTSNSKTARPITDILSGQTRYYTVTYSTFTKDNIYGDEYYSFDKTYSRLYDVNGKLLKDWTETLYSECIGDWVLEGNYPDPDDRYQEKCPGRLFNPYSHDIIDYVDMLGSFDKQYAYISRFGNYVYSLVDRNGNIIYELKRNADNSAENIRYFPLGEYIVQETSLGENDELSDYVFYNPDGSVAGTKTGVAFSRCDCFEGDDYCYCINGVRYDIENARGGEIQPISSEDLYITYYSTDTFISQTYENNTEVYYLYDEQTKKPVAGPYLLIETPTSNNSNFYGVTDKGIEVFDKTGKIINTLEQENVDRIDVYPDFISYQYDAYTYTGFADSDLNPTDLGKYNRVTKYNDSTDKDKQLYLGEYYLDKATAERCRYDILSSDFKPIITGLSQTGGYQDGKIAVMRGQNIGLMDLNGNWILKYKQNDFINAD